MVQNQLFHDRQAYSLHDPPFDLTNDRLRIESLSNILSRVDSDHLHQAQLGVDINDRAMPGNCEVRMSVSLTVLIRLLCGRVSESDSLFPIVFDEDSHRHHHFPVTQDPFVAQIVPTVIVENSVAEPCGCLQCRAPRHHGLAGGRCRPRFIDL